jgi:CBS domain-containing protein
MRTHQIMTRQVITIAADAPIVDAANIMLDKHISGLPVIVSEFAARGVR